MHTIEEEEINGTGEGCRGLLPACPCLWTENSDGLVSLWDMVRIYAANFIRLGARLETCTAGAFLQLAPRAPVDKKAWAAFVDVTDTIDKDCVELGFETTVEIAAHHKNRFSDFARRSCTITNEDVASAAGEIFRAYQFELRSRVFVHVHKERSIFFENPQLFGEKVHSAFGTSAQEIASAGSCYALEQETACVMHLMRALEPPLTVMAGEFGVSAVRENWHNIIEQIESKVRGLGPADGADWKDRQEFYSKACMEFMHLKNAWRNHAMHNRARYNGSEAKGLMEHVGEFMKRLSERLHE